MYLQSFNSEVLVFRLKHFLSFCGFIMKIFNLLKRFDF